MYTRVYTFYTNFAQGSTRVTVTNCDYKPGHKHPTRLRTREQN